MASNVELQGIQFKIVGDTKKAVSGIKPLISSLQKLKTISDSGIGLKKISEEIKDFNKALDERNRRSLSAVAASLRQITSASSGLGNIRKQLKSIANIDFSNLTTAAEKITTIANAAGSMSGASRGKTGGNTGEAEDFGTEQVNGGKVNVKPIKPPNTAETNKSLDETKRKLKETQAYAKGLRQILADLGKSFLTSAKSAGRFGLKLLSLPFKKLVASVKNALGPIRQFLSSLGRIAMYRAIRSIVSGITTALKEGIMNLYQYSIIMNTTFHTAMDSAASDALYLKNSLAAAVAPIIEMLIPAFDALAERVVSVMNLVAQLFATLSGKSTYSKAVKTTKEFAEASGDAAKETRMLLSGFDELNRFQEKSGSGKDDNYGLMFEEADVGSELGDFAKLLKDAFEAGDWSGLGSLIAEKLNSLFAGIEWDTVGIKVGKSLDHIFETAFAFLKNLDFSQLGSNLATFLNNVFENVNFETLGRLVVRKITSLFDMVAGFIRTLNWDSTAKAIGDFFTGAFREASEWLHANDFGDLARTLSDGIKKILDKLREAVKEMDWYALGKSIGEFIGNIDWWGIFTRVADIVWTAFKGVAEGLLSTSGGRMFLLLFGLIKGLTTVFSLTEGLFKLSVERWVATGISPMETLPTLIGGIAKKVGIAALGVSDAILLVYDAKALYEADEGYTAALLAHHNETEKALNGYKKLYEEKGKEVADKWAEMTYQIDTTNMNFEQAQQALAEKIETYWDDVPQNMFDGFMAGWNHYFGANGEGLLALLKDAFMGVVNGIKDFLGIHSPSTVFFDIGADLVNGLFNGISETWTAITEFFTKTFADVTESFRVTWETVKTNTSETWNQIKQEVTSRISETKEKVTQDVNTLRQNLSAAWNATKTETVTAWTALKTEASSKFMEIKNTIYTRMNEATNYLRSISWVSIGSNLVSGFLNGLKSAWSAVTSWVSSAASALTSKLKSAFKIGSPSKLWADIGTYLDLGLQEGLEGGTNRLVATASGIASAVNSAMIPSPTVPTYSVNAPAVSNGTEDYAEEESMSGILPLMEQMFAFMQTNAQSGQDIKVMIDGREVFNAVVNENRRAIQRTGESPIRV